MKKKSMSVITAAILVGGILLPVHVMGTEVQSGDTADFDDTVVEASSIEEMASYSTVNYDAYSEDGSLFQTQALIVRADEIISDYGASEVYQYEDIIYLKYDSIEATEEAYERLAEDYTCFPDSVIEIEDHETEEEIELSDTVIKDTDIAQKLGIEEIVNQTYEQEIVIATLDSGVYLDHVLLQGRLLDGYDFTLLPKEQEYPIPEYDPSLMNDTNGHGTHVAGIIAQFTPSNVKILPLKIASEKNSSMYYVVLGFKYAVQQDVDIINMSFTGTGSLAKNHWLGQDFPTAEEKGIVTVAASGNKAIDISDGNVYPADTGHAVCVNACNADGSFASSYSNYGDQSTFISYGRVYSAAISSPTSYVYKSGTSMATPCVSAQLADIKCLSPELTGSDLISRAKTYCKHLATDGEDWDPYYGYGNVNLTNLLTDVSEGYKKDLWRYGDVNADGKVSLLDLSKLLAMYGSDQFDCDFNQDHIVNAQDLSILLSNYGMM